MRKKKTSGARVRRILKEKMPPVDLERLRKTLIGSTHSLEALSLKLKDTPGRVLDAILELKSRGVMLVEWDPGVWTISKAPVGEEEGKYHLRISSASGLHRFGIISDTHLGSKYERLDICEDLYDWFYKEGIRTVYHAGNWIDGEARFNKFDLLPEAHGMQAQLDYFVRHYPQRNGIQTHYVAGDDHEGWYSQREGVDIGRMLQHTGEKAGRRDLKYLGYKEAFITLEHKRSGTHSRLLIDHPGGGSAYADSYAAQKRIEACQSGEKPGMWVFGHWHKAGYFRPREVHVVLAGCTKDLDTFGRKKGLRYDMGGWIIEVFQAEQGALLHCIPQYKAYYDRKYHAGTAFSMSGKVKR